MTPKTLTPAQIRQLRKDLDKTQVEFAKLCHIASGITVSRWEHGHCEPRPSQAERLNDMWLANENRKGAEHELDLREKKLELTI